MVRLTCASLAIGVSCLMTSLSAHAGQDVDTVEAVPHIDKRGQAGFRTFRRQDRPRAFAISPSGTWGWGSARTTYQAKRNALAYCGGSAAVPCRLFAVNGEVVWQPQPGDEKISSPSEMAPSTTEEAAVALDGFEYGNRFPDFAFENENGDAVRLSDLRGKFVVMNFSASWCPYCRAEMPGIQSCYEALKGEPGIQFVILNVREGVHNTRRWMRGYGWTLPVYDSGLSGTNRLKASNGMSMNLSVPTSFILDPNGIVLRRHKGDYGRWSDYIEPLRRLAAEASFK